MKMRAVVIVGLLVVWVAAGIASGQIVANPIGRVALQQPSAVRGRTCSAWVKMSHSEKTLYLLGALAMADHLYVAANDDDVPEVSIEPENIVYFPRSDVFYASVIDRLCTSSPPTTNVVTLLFMSQ